MSETNRSICLPKTLSWVVTLAVAGLLVGMWFARSGGQPDSDIAALLPEPRPLAPFTLVRHDGTTLDLDALRGKWSFLFFGYTHCPDVCPTTLMELGRAHKLMSNDAGLLDDTQFIFVSVDPERDTPELLGSYVAYFNEAFIGATGNTDQLKAVTTQLGIRHSRGDNSASGYIVNHSSAVLLIDPQLRYYARLKAPHYAEEIRQQFLAIRQRYAGPSQ
jgi:protein SCO1/2